MRVVAQRVSHAKVLIDGETVSQIGRGLLLLVGVKNDDAPADADFLSQK
jgi:D-tyrosyl-tRNA(Tyr) deacylase